jgi:hypothetical protein
MGVAPVRPLIANAEQKTDQARFHRQVFAAYGGPRKACVFCKKPGATDSAHVIPSNLLGPLRYADPRLARPAHRKCHDEQHAGMRKFPRAVVRDAYKAHNAIAKVPLEIPPA